MTTSAPAIEVLSRIDAGDRSIRVQRELVVHPDGELRPRVAIVVYRQLHGGKWVREKSIGVRSGETRTVLAGLEVAAKGGAVISAKQGVLL